MSRIILIVGSGLIAASFGACVGEPTTRNTSPTERRIGILGKAIFSEDPNYRAKAVQELVEYAVTDNLAKRVILASLTDSNSESRDVMNLWEAASVLAWKDVRELVIQTKEEADIYAAITMVGLMSNRDPASVEWANRIAERQDLKLITRLMAQSIVADCESADAQHRKAIYAVLREETMATRQLIAFIALTGPRTLATTDMLDALIAAHVEQAVATDKLDVTLINAAAIVGKSDKVGRMFADRIGRAADRIRVDADRGETIICRAALTLALASIDETGGRGRLLKEACRLVGLTRDYPPVMSLHRLMTSRLLERLPELIKDDDIQVSRGAILLSSISRRRAKECTPELFKILQSRYDRELKKWAAFALGWVADDRAVDLLKRQLSIEKDEVVGSEIIWAIDLLKFETVMSYTSEPSR